MVRKISKLSLSIPPKVRFIAGAFRASYIVFDLYQVLIEGRHGFWVFVCSSHLQQFQIDCASLLNCICMPRPFSDADLFYEIEKYVSKLPLSL